MFGKWEDHKCIAQTSKDVVVVDLGTSHSEARLKGGS